ncbi:FAD:protein FMN transferase [Phenylobacterium sp. VNQ135]|uniref:FAD:protein FMN transferase n=1 Tax=Phenylobacterium sp. VNQ135 TaxID=3400922 RepID=UPI003C067AC6
MVRVAVPLHVTRETARPREGRAVRLSGPTMGVSWTLQALAPSGLGDEAIREAVQGACDRVVAQMSDWEPESDLSRFNVAPAGTWVAIPPEFATVARAALDLAEASGGAFDPGLGDLVRLWGFGPAGPVDEPPGAADLAAARAGWRDLRLEDGRLLQPGGVRLDLSGIAKGYGVDLAAEALTALGVRDYLLEIGGELRGGGVKANGEPWWVQVERPPEARLDEPPVLIALHELSVATSGDWRRTFTAQGRRYSHTLHPLHRAPVAEPPAAVTVLHEGCMQADALCTALTVLGPDAEAFAARRDVAALFLWRTPDGFEERMTPAFQRLLA